MCLVGYLILKHTVIKVSWNDQLIHHYFPYVRFSNFSFVGIILIRNFLLYAFIFHMLCFGRDQYTKYEYITVEFKLF